MSRWSGKVARQLGTDWRARQTWAEVDCQPKGSTLHPVGVEEQLKDLNLELRSSLVFQNIHCRRGVRLRKFSLEVSGPVRRLLNC